MPIRESQTKERANIDWTHMTRDSGEREIVGDNGRMSIYAVNIFTNNLLLEVPFSLAKAHSLRQ
jgi:hypothetical protein